MIFAARFERRVNLGRFNLILIIYLYNVYIIIYKIMPISSTEVRL